MTVIPVIFLAVLVIAAIFWFIAGGIASLRVAGAARQNERMAVRAARSFRAPFGPISELHTPADEEEPDKEGT